MTPNYRLCLSLAVLLAVPSLVQAQKTAGIPAEVLAKADYRTFMAWQSASGRKGPALASAVPGTSELMVTVQLSDESARPVSRYVRLIARQGRFATAAIDPRYLPEIAADPAMVRIEAGGRSRPYDDPADLSIRAAHVPVKTGITGRGVIVGIVDTGIDWRHPDFRNPDGSTRILAICDLSEEWYALKSGDLGAKGPYQGIEVTRDQINLALGGQGTIREMDYIGHGTMVAGTAAASPSLADSLNYYGGAAPGADIVAVKVCIAPRDSFLDNVKIQNGITYVDSLARALGRPYVVNLSLGSNFGPHDGTSAYEQFIAGFIEDTSRGRAIVVAAGNSRQDSAHANGTMDAKVGGGTVMLELEVGKRGGGDDNLFVDIWVHSEEKGANFVLVSPDSSYVGRYLNGQFDEINRVKFSMDGWVRVANNMSGANPLTGDKEIEFLILDSGLLEHPPADTRVGKGTWRIYLTATNGTFDAYLGATEGLEARFVSHVNEEGTMGVPATAPALISVGAYVERTDWLTLADGYTWASELVGESTPGEIASFSSLGPNRRGDLKPEITAPGQWVMASLSSGAWPEEAGSLSMFWTSHEDRRHFFFARDSLHAAAQGTSFSAPLITGICALLLEADPALSNRQLKDLLTATARVDSLVPAAPNNEWGWGRADAFAAVSRIISRSGDSLVFSGRFDPPDTLRSDSLRFIIEADFARSALSLSSFELELSWPVDRLALYALPGLTVDPRLPVFSFDTTGIASGRLIVKGRMLQMLPGVGEILGLYFRPVDSRRADGVKVTYSLTGAHGDWLEAELAGLAFVHQAAAVSIRPVSTCLAAGDLDGNGRVDIFDLLALLKVIAGKVEPTDCADVNLDGRTDIFDLLQLLKLI